MTSAKAMIQPIIERIEGIHATDFPDLIRSAPAAFSQLFASLASGDTDSAPHNARWSILMSAPAAELRLTRRNSLHFRPLTTEGQPPCLPENGDFLDAFGRWVDPTRDSVAPLAHELPFVGGWSFYLSYELAGQIEPSLDLPSFAVGTPDDSGFPVAVAQYHAAALVFDHEASRMYLVQDGRSSLAADTMRTAIIEYRAGSGAGDAMDDDLALGAVAADDPAIYEAGVARILDYLQAGDVFQANLSRAWRFSTPQSDAGWRIFRRLGRYNPAPFAAWYRLDEGQIISSSPERLVDHVSGRVSTRPIAGTRRRDADRARDRALMDELRAHPKERAEHVMLIDLERNDLGRVCQPGSVQVDELMTIESFAHVHHLVSNVSGKLRPDRSVFDLLAATFPGGTITGCPKVRCMEILSELEATGRGPYTGSVGYLSLDGRMDSNILIRTVFLATDGSGEFRAGAGVVADSEPLRERIETEEKARGLLLALGAMAP
ncbi:chorismate-binding protein [Halothiobacillus diazotrophicus]|uniref:chorismate-binding protein n=1 Tax=Halothiobacillus diazotrophicus TaxID=1860122 RepID=UPI000A8CE398|nr:chorismate-binding protein [Halothiobacillus diazotrophicus]